MQSPKREVFNVKATNAVRIAVDRDEWGAAAIMELTHIGAGTGLDRAVRRSGISTWFVLSVAGYLQFR